MNQSTLTLKAPAKINLSLDVTGRRPNGYHDLRMVMQTLDLCDTLSFSILEEDEIRLSTRSAREGECGFSQEFFQECIGQKDDNLVVRVIKQLKNEFHITNGVDVCLTKQIPIAAGLAGGSSDAACTYKAMNQLFQLGLSTDELMKRAVSLGADIPYCILGGTALAEGIGEVLTPLPKLPECTFVLIKPDIAVSTKWVYQNLHVDEINLHPEVDRMCQAIQEQKLQGISDTMGNVLADVTIPSYPLIRELQTALIKAGAENALMSGSGPTVFGLFANVSTAEKAKNALQDNYPAYEIYIARPVY